MSCCAHRSSTQVFRLPRNGFSRNGWIPPTVCMSISRGTSVSSRGCGPSLSIQDEGRYHDLLMEALMDALQRLKHTGTEEE